MWLGKDLKYYKHFAQHLQLEQDGDSGWRVSWKKKFPTTLAPLEPIMQSLTGKLLILTTGFSAKKENYEICNLSENNPLPRDILPYRTLKDSLTK